MPSILFSLLLGCQPESSPKQPQDTAAETESDALEITPPTETTPGWTLGGVESCANPSIVPSYTDVSASFGYSGNTYPVYNIEGAIALQSFNDDWWIWQIGTEQPYAWNSRGDQIVIESESVTVRLYILDLNNDGEDDLVLIGEFLQIIWSVQRPNEVSEVLLPFQAQRGVRDVGIIDIDGDGDKDLWAILAYSDLNSHEGWGYIFEMQSDGTYAEPYEYLDREVFGAAFDGLVMDWDQDQDPDLYVCNDFGNFWGGNHILINENGSLLEGNANGADIVTACMGTSAADLDMDQRLDLYSTATAGHHLLRGTAEGYIDFTGAYDLPIAFNEQMLWGAHITDYNNDGLLDILVGTSGFTRITQSGPTVEPYPIWMMEQQPDHTFVEVGATLGLEQNSASRAVLAHDMNGDGVVDLIISDAKRLAHVYLSDGCTANNWIEVTGPENSIVRVVAGDQIWTVHLTSTPGMAASMPSTAHIGLGDIEQIDWIDVEVPWQGTHSILGPIEARQRLNLTIP